MRAFQNSLPRLRVTDKAVLFMKEKTVKVLKIVIRVLKALVFMLSGKGKARKKNVKQDEGL